MNFSIQQLEAEKENIRVSYVKLMREKRKLVEKLDEIEDKMRQILRIEKEIHRRITYYHFRK